MTLWQDWQARFGAMRWERANSSGFALASLELAARLEGRLQRAPHARWRMVTDEAEKHDEMLRQLPKGVIPE